MRAESEDFEPGGEAKFLGCHNGPLPNGKTSTTTVYVGSNAAGGTVHVYVNDSRTGQELAHVVGAAGADERTFFWDTSGGGGQGGDGQGLALINGSFALPSADFEVRVIVTGGAASDRYRAELEERQA